MPTQKEDNERAQNAEQLREDIRRKIGSPVPEEKPSPAAEPRKESAREFVERARRERNK